MSKFSSWGVGLMLGMACGVNASAMTLELSALRTDTAAGNVQSFSLTFDDLDGDMLFSLDELLTFSGTQAVFAPTFAIQMNSITAVPDTIATDGGATGWTFSSRMPGETGFALGAAADAGDFTYSVSSVDAHVPLPATGLLLLSGIVALSFARRRS